MPTQIIDGFRLNSAAPIDDRFVTAGTVSRDNMTYKYVGLRVYDTAQKISFVWDGSKWADDGGSNGGTLNLQAAQANYLPKFTTTGITNSNVRESVVGNKKFIGINLSSNVTLNSELQVGGTVCATTLCGNLNGSNLVNQTITLGKIAPAGQAGTFVLKSVNNTLSWGIEGAQGTATTQLDTTSTNTFLAFVDSTSSINFRVSCNSINTFIGADLSTSQLVLSSTNNCASPPYSFAGSKSTGMYGSSTEVGISLAGNKRIFANANTTRLNVGTNTIVDASGSCVGLCKDTTVHGTLCSQSLCTTANVSVDQDLTVTGTTTLTNLCASGTVTISGSLALTQPTSITAPLVVNSSLSICSDQAIAAQFRNTNVSGCGLVVKHYGCGLVLRQEDPSEFVTNKITFNSLSNKERGSFGYLEAGTSVTDSHIKVKNDTAVFSFQNDGRFKTRNLQVYNSMVYTGIYTLGLNIKVGTGAATNVLPAYEFFYNNMTPVNIYDKNSTYGQKLTSPNGSRWIFDNPVQITRAGFPNTLYRMRVWHYLGDSNYTVTVSPQWINIESAGQTVGYFICIEKPTSVDSTGNKVTGGTDQSAKFFDIITHYITNEEFVVDLAVFHHTSDTNNEK